MYTLLELKDKRGLLQDENIALTVKIEKEKRKLTEDEQKEFDGRLEKIAELESAIELEEEKRKVDSEKIGKRKMTAKEPEFRLMKSILDVAEKRDIDEVAKAVSTRGRDEFRKSNIAAGGHIILPSSIPMTAEERSAVVSGQAHGTTAGGYAVGYDNKTVLPPLTNYLVLAKAGATFLTGLVGDVTIPTYTGTTVMWKGEVTSATDGAGTWGQVTLSPKRLTAFIDVSKMFLLQDAVGAEAMLKENIAKAIAVKLESSILGTALLSTTVPAGIFNTLAVHGPTTFTHAIAVGLETSVNTNNALFGNLAFITNAAGKGIAKSTLRTATYGDRMIMEDNDEILGYPVYVTNSCASGTGAGNDWSTAACTTTGGEGFVFGNWSDLLIGQWGGYDLLVDPYTQAALGTVRLVVNCYFDADLARSTSFAAKAIR
jgi:HK97 family phage major capsid protein